MRSKNDSDTRRFIVTTSGLSATRWLAFVLSSHPDVFVAHGHFPLDSVLHKDFREEKKKGDIESLTIGNDSATFYRTASFDQVFAAYRKLKPDAHAYGNIHSYTVHTLMGRVGSLDQIHDIAVANVLRHPVTYIDSHFSLVRSAEAHAPLYRHYVENAFPRALRAFPELFLIDCVGYREFLAFAVSCFSVFNMTQDFVYEGFQHFQMELLTTNVEALKNFCETLCGIAFSAKQLESFIRVGAINRHRKEQSSADPLTIYSSWPDWKRDIAIMMIPETLLDQFSKRGYDVDMLRLHGTKRDIATNRAKPDAACLADYLKRMNEHHPLLNLLGPPSTAGPRLREADDPNPKLIENDYHGFNIVAFRGQAYGLSCSIGPIDLSVLPVETLEEYRRRGDCFVASSIDEIRDLIVHKERFDPILLEPEFRGFNLVEYAGQVYGLACSLGPIDLRALPDDRLQEHIQRHEIFVAASVTEVKAEILLAVEIGPVLLEEGYKGFNIVGYEGRIYALSCSLGPVDLTETSPEGLHRYCQQSLCFVGKTFGEVKREIESCEHVN